jgi:hypothetical protein
MLDLALVEWSLISAPACPSMVAFQKQTPQPRKTKAELREMLAQAVRNTQPELKPRPPKANKDRRELRTSTA